MDKNTIENILQFSTEIPKYNTGLATYKRNLVINEYAKEDGDITIFYATVIDEHHRQNYTSMVSIDTNKRVILDKSCDCQSVLSSKNKGSQICPHMIATVLKGMNSLENTFSNEAYSESITISPSVKVSIGQSRGGYLGMDLDIDGVDKIEYRRVFNSFKENKKLHRLFNGNYLDLQNENLVEALKLIDILGIYNDFENMKIPNNKALYLENMIENENLDFIDGTKYVNNIVKKFRKTNNKKIEVPTNLNEKLRDYQINGFEFFTTLSNYEFGGILADEMGLGKTIQALTFILSKHDKKSIVIAPTVLIYNWKNEIDKFTPDLKVAIVHGNKVDRERLLNNIDDYNLVLTTYTTFRNDLEKYENITFDYCIIDEAQNIKNPDSIITNAVKSINAKVKFALTGTPIENNLIELWSIFDFIMPGYLYNKDKFKKIFGSEGNNVSDLKNLIKPFMLRRTKKEVITELPDKIEQNYVIELGKEHRRVYNGYIKLIKQKILENNQDNITIFSYLTKLRQLSLAPEAMVKNYQGKNTKLDVLMNIIDESGDKKILIFSQFTKVLGIIGERLKEENISFTYLDGKTSAEKRVKLVEEFNNSDKYKVFLISLKAGGTGLNLTSASMVVHFDPWWNPAVENQASDRAHRMGQKNVVNVIKLIAKGTVEERVVSLQENKKELIDDVIDSNLENSSVLKKLSKDELIDLFM